MVDSSWVEVAPSPQRFQAPAILLPVRQQLVLLGIDSDISIDHVRLPTPGVGTLCTASLQLVRTSCQGADHPDTSLSPSNSQVLRCRLRPFDGLSPHSGQALQLQVAGIFQKSTEHPGNISVMLKAFEQLKMYTRSCYWNVKKVIMPAEVVNGWFRRRTSLEECHR